MLTEKDIEFIEKFKESDNPERLLLGRGKYPGINVPLCVNCIMARKKIKGKLPEWYGNTRLEYPNLLCTEQCSSQATAEYKASVLKRLLCFGTQAGHTGADLTAGLGTDTLYLSSITEKFYCYEQDPGLCRALEYNMREFKRDNITVTEGKITRESVAALPGNLSFIYIDPARREEGDSSRRKYSIKECTPNLLELSDSLLEKSGIVMAKLSPMADIRECLGLLPQTTEVHVVAVDNECRELLFVMRPESTGIPHGCQALVYGVNICSTDRETVSGSFTYRLREEEEAVARYCSRPGRYLYEPYRHLLKCGAFKLLSQRYNLLKLAPATHLYTSDEPCNGFPGKIFAITEVCDFSKQTMKAMAKRFPVINLTARNFPLGSDAMKKSYGIKDGGDRHLFVTTLTDSRKTIILTQIPTNGD